jgi:hypothetical protein
VTAEICAEFAAVPSPATSTVLSFGPALLADSVVAKLVLKALSSR